MLNYSKKTTGFSLIELLIAMTIGGGAIAGLATFVGNAAASNSKLLMHMRLNEELDTVVNLITTDIQRAGFHADIVAAVKQPNLFDNNVFYPISISEHPQESINSCVMFAYDKDKNGEINNGIGNENYGFRLHNYAIEMRQDGANCEAGGWQDLTDTSVTIVDKLTFSIIFESQTGIAIRVHLSASVKLHSNISKQLIRDVFIFSQQHLNV